MKKWQDVLWADLGLAIVFAVFMFVFFDDAVSKVIGAAAGLLIGAIAGIFTFLGGARIARKLRDLPPTPAPNAQKTDPGVRRDGSRSRKWEREPLLTDVIAIMVGLGGIAVGYTRQFNAIEYPRGDVRGTPEFDATFLTISIVFGLFAIVVGSIRLVQGLRRRRP
jgi:hypothetical protein